MKVKVKCTHENFNTVKLGIYSWCSAALWIVDVFIGLWDICKRNENSVSIRKIEHKHAFSNLFQQTTRPILITFSGRIEEFFVPNKKTSQVPADKFQG